VCRTRDCRGYPVRFDIGAEVDDLTKQVVVPLSYEFVTDLPDTRDYAPAFRAFLNRLKLKMHDPDSQQLPNLSGIPFRIDIDWPFQMDVTYE
jgi:hypothetical protein